MGQELVSFAAARPHKSFWEMYWGELTLLLVATPFVWMDAEFDWTNWDDRILYGFWCGLVVYVLYRYLTRGKMKTFEYRFTDQELLIQVGNKKPVRYPFSSIKQFSILTLEPKPTAVFDSRLGGLYTGTWRWNLWEMTLYATRRDRLVLLDTTAGLIGLSPALEVEDAFSAELQKRTGLTPSQDDFTPEYAERPAASWPALMMAVMLGSNMIVLFDLYPAVDNAVIDALRGILFGLIMINVSFMYRWQKRYLWAFWMVVVALCLLFVVLLSLL